MSVFIETTLSCKERGQGTAALPSVDFVDASRRGRALAIQKANIALRLRAAAIALATVSFFNYLEVGAAQAQERCETCEDRVNSDFLNWTYTPSRPISLDNGILDVLSSDSLAESEGDDDTATVQFNVDGLDRVSEVSVRADVTDALATVSTILLGYGEATLSLTLEVSVLGGDVLCSVEEPLYVARYFESGTPTGPVTLSCSPGPLAHASFLVVSITAHSGIVVGGASTAHASMQVEVKEMRMTGCAPDIDLTNGFTTVFSSGSGMGGYDLLSTDDKLFAFDYDSSGHADHVVAYRPGDGIFFVLERSGEDFVTAFSSGSGVGSYDLLSTDDRLFALDYNSSGRADHIAAYRPGDGIFYVLERNGQGFVTVFSSGSGVGGYDLLSPADRAFAFDYEGTGRRDHIALYRPGHGIFYVVKRSGDAFETVFSSGSGVGGYDLLSSADRAFAFDLNDTGRLDHVALYRPGSGVFYVVGASGDGFETVLSSGRGIGGYDLLSPADRAFAFDPEGTGRANHVVLYRPGTGTLFVVGRSGSTFEPVFESACGVGTYDLLSVEDHAFALDYESQGRSDHIVLYRPGRGIAQVVR